MPGQHLIQRSVSFAAIFPFLLQRPEQVLCVRWQSREHIAPLRFDVLLSVTQCPVQYQASQACRVQYCIFLRQTCAPTGAIDVKVVQAKFFYDGLQFKHVVRNCKQPGRFGLWIFYPGRAAASRLVIKNDWIARIR
jgi:hypothetical protein